MVQDKMTSVMMAGGMCNCKENVRLNKTKRKKLKHYRRKKLYKKLMVITFKAIIIFAYKIIEIIPQLFYSWIEENSEILVVKQWDRVQKISRAKC